MESTNHLHLRKFKKKGNRKKETKEKGKRKQMGLFIFYFWNPIIKF